MACPRAFLYRVLLFSALQDMAFLSRFSFFFHFGGYRVEQLSVHGINFYLLRLSLLVSCIGIAALMALEMCL